MGVMDLLKQNKVDKVGLLLKPARTGHDTHHGKIRWHSGPACLSVLVHGLLLMLLVVSFSWRSVVQPLQVAQVELWDSLPAHSQTSSRNRPSQLPKIEPPPVPKPEPAPPPEPKAEIQVKVKPPIEMPKESGKEPEAEMPKPKEDEIKRLQQLLAEDDKHLEHEAQQKDVQQLAEARNAAEARKAAEALTASSGVVNEYKAKIQAKIRRFVNKQVCGNGKPVLEFAISMMPTGEIAGNPRLTRSSGLPACDMAVEYAIQKAQPLPLPPQPELFAQFRDLTLQFRPNEE